jgi:hypothetical protein
LQSKHGKKQQQQHSYKQINKAKQEKARKFDLNFVYFKKSSDIFLVRFRFSQGRFW